MKKTTIITLLLIGTLLYSSCSNKGISDQKSLKTVIDNALDVSMKQSLLMANSLANQKTRLPKTLNKEGKLETSKSSWWCSGFFPGQLWYMYEYSKSDSIKNWAIEYTSRVEDQQYTTDNHDVGFMIFCSFGNGYRLTQNPDYLKVIETASTSLSTRFNSKTGCIRSWDKDKWNQQWQYPVIIDNMMNLELLMWSSQQFNNPKFSDIATSHANTTMKNHFRDDYSTYHVVSYDTITGLPEKKNTAQGYSNESAWARGQGWGLYGYTMMYRMTKDVRYLNQARHIAQFIINHPNLPADKIPYWDFNDPNIPDAKRDASAGALICSALIELSGYVSKSERKQYLAVAEKQIRTLSSPAYLAEPGTNGHFILKHSVGHMPNKTEVDVPLSYADYYYVESLMRMRNLLNKAN